MKNRYKVLFNLRTTSMNIVLTGVLSLTGTAAASATTFGATAPSSDKRPGIERVKSVEAPAITADSAVKLDFGRTPVVTVAAPPVVHPILGVMSVNPAARPSSNFDVAATITAAMSEVGQSFPTGWNQPGECLVAAKRWIVAGGGNWYSGGTPLGNYAGAQEVSYENAAPGDVIQYLSPYDPHAWIAGVHTVLVTKNNGDGTLGIIEANNPGGSGFVSANESWTPAPPSGTTFKIFRF